MCDVQTESQKFYILPVVVSAVRCDSESNAAVGALCQSVYMHRTEPVNTRAENVYFIDGEKKNNLTD